MSTFAYLDRVQDVQAKDHDYVDRKDRQYGSSWKKRGGVGAFMMLARKWDRLEEMLSRGSDIGTEEWPDAAPYDIFGHIFVQQGSGQGADGTILAEVRDLRRYLLLVEAWAVEQGWVGDVERKKAFSVIPKDDVYGILAWVWECSTLEAKKRLFEKVYGEEPGTRTSLSGAQLLMSWETSGVLAGVRHRTTGRTGTLDGSGTTGIGGSQVGVTWDDGESDTISISELEPVYRARPGATDPAPEPVAAPVDRPEAAPARAIAAGDDGVATSPPAAFEPSLVKHPVSATNAEYISFASTPVESGDMKGVLWRDLYELSQREDGRWFMLPIYHAEYGI